MGIYTALIQEERDYALKPFPGGRKSILACELNIFSLDDLARYEALSYTWDRSRVGGQPSLRCICVNHVERVVSKGLEIALRHLQHLVCCYKHKSFQNNFLLKISFAEVCVIS